MIKKYYHLTKPGIIRGNAITAIAGFLLASGSNINLGLLLATTAGLSLVIASGCVLNNLIDRDIDSKMARTKDRALVVGEISIRSATIYGCLLGLVGFLLLAWQTNLRALSVAFLGFIFYVVVYSLVFKRRSVHGAVVGSISGATPPVVGYVAAANNFDVVALILFLVLVFWQMPHFYAIAFYRSAEYRAAKIPVLPISRSIRATKLYMLVYIEAFIAASLALFAIGQAGYVYFVIMGALGLAWLFMATAGLEAKNNDKWARKMFNFSLLVITTFSAVVSLDFLLV